MILARSRWCSHQEMTQSDKDMEGSVWQDHSFGLSTWAAVFLAMIVILETKIEKLNWLDGAGREERHR